MLMRFFYQAADVFTVRKSVHSEEEGVEVKVIMILKYLKYSFSILNY